MHIKGIQYSSKYCMEYKCITCDYSTLVKFAYKKHIASNRHNRKVVESTNNIESIKYVIPMSYPCQTRTCQYCQNAFTTSSSLSRHQKTCIEKHTTIKELDELKKKVRKLEEDTIYYKKLINGAGLLVNKSMSTLSYVIKNYPNAPKLSKLADYSYLERSEMNDNFDLMEMIFTHHTNGTLSKYLGNFIVRAYIKVDVNEQSIWNSDSTRLTYIIRNIIDDTLEWEVDKKGIKTKEQIIDPLLSHLHKLLVKCLDENDLIKHLGETANKMKDRIDKINSSVNIIGDIKNGILNDGIVKHIGPYFSVTKGNTIELKGCDIQRYIPNI